MLEVVTGTEREGPSAVEVAEFAIAEGPGGYAVGIGRIGWGVVGIDAGAPSEFIQGSLEVQSGGAVHAQLVEDLRALKGWLGVSGFQPVIVTD